MKPSQLGAQMYSFREFIKTPEEVRSTLREIRKMGYEAVQLSSSIAPMPNAELSAMLKENNLIPCSSHDPADRILEVPEEIGKRLQELSCPHCAVPFPPYTFPASEEEVVNLAKKINQSAQVLRRFGVTLSYHNHSQEFQHFNGKRMLDIIYANAPDIQAELDTFWVQRGGDNPERWIRRFPGRTDVLHIKDYGIVPPNEIVMCPIGDGNLDWDVLLTAAEQCGVKYYVVEHDGDCADPFESFAASMRFVKGNFVS